MAEKVNFRRYSLFNRTKKGGLNPIQMSQSATQQSKWIETGYQHFAEYGPSELKIKNIAHDAGIARTTFYHFFTDIADFTDRLLDHHREMAKEYRAELKACQTYNPDTFLVIEAYRTGIFFHRQLFLHKENPTFYLTYQVLNKTSNEILYPLWAEFFGYDGNSLVGKEILLMLIDLWYLNLTPEDFSFKDFLEHSLQIKRQIELFSRSHQIQALGKF